MSRSWKTKAVVVTLLVLAGCSSSSTAVPDAGPVDGGDEPLKITVSGRAQVHPAAVAWLTSRSQPVPDLAGVTLTVEEPLKLALGDPLGLFGKVELTDAGTFSVSDVDVSRVLIGVSAGMDDRPDGGSPALADGGYELGWKRAIRSTTVLWDVALEQGKPTANISGGKVYAVPGTFHDQLTEAVTPARISAITGGKQVSLFGAGFILGRVVDAAGAPVAGVKVVPDDTRLAPQFFYPTADLTSVDPQGTSSNGLFLYVHNAGEVATLKIKIEGHSEYKQRTAGAAKEAAVVMTVYPGLTQP